MATLNVLDYGAAGDGSTDDTDAINSALDDAQPGDEVFIPSGTYMVREDSSREAVGIHRAGDDVVIRGEVNADETESMSVIRMMDVPVGGGAGNKWVLGCDGDQASNVGPVTVRDLVIQGNRDANRSSSFNVMGFNFYESGTGFDITFLDCVFEDIPGIGVSIDESGKVTLDHCTIRDTDRHGFTGAGSGNGSPNDPDIVLRDVKFDDIGWNRNGTGFDIGGGYTELTNIYCGYADMGFKIGDTAGSPEWFGLNNANLVDSGQNSGWRFTGDSLAGSDIEFNNVQWLRTELDGIQFEGGGNYSGTTILVDSPNQSRSGGRTGVVVKDGSNVDVDTLAVQNNPATEGIEQASGSLSVGTYYHYNNAEGPGDTGGIGQVINEERPQLDVPGPNDVGAYAPGGTSPPDGGGGDDGGDSGGDNGGDGGGSVETRLFEVVAGENALADYTFTVEGGEVFFGSESEPEPDGNDAIIDNGDGSYTVEGRVGGGYPDDYEVAVGASITSFSTGLSSYTLVLDGQEVSASNLPVTVGGGDDGGGDSGGDNGGDDGTNNDGPAESGFGDFGLFLALGIGIGALLRRNGDE